MTARRARTDVHEPISSFSLWMAVIGFILAGLFILIMLGAVFLMNGQAVPQTPVILGAPR